MPGASVVKNPPPTAGDAKDVYLIPGWEKIPWSRKWQPTAILLPVKFHGQRILVDYSSWSCKELDTTEHT